MFVSQYAQVVFVALYFTLLTLLSIMLAGEITQDDLFVRKTRLFLVALGLALTASVSLFLIRNTISKIKAYERLQVLVNTSPLSMLFFGKNLKITDCNKKALNLFGLTSKQE